MFSDGRFDITVNSIEAVNEITTERRRYTASPGNMYVVLNVSVRHSGTRADRFLPRPVGGPSIIFDTDVRYRPTELIGHPDDFHGVLMQPLSTRTGIIVFTIPEEVIMSGRPFTFSTCTASGSRPWGSGQGEEFEFSF